MLSVCSFLFCGLFILPIGLFLQKRAKWTHSVAGLPACHGLKVEFPAISTCIWTKYCLGRLWSLAKGGGPLRNKPCRWCQRFGYAVGELCASQSIRCQVIPQVPTAIATENPVFMPFPSWWTMTSYTVSQNKPFLLDVAVSVFSCVRKVTQKWCQEMESVLS